MNKVQFMPLALLLLLGCNLNPDSGSAEHSHQSEGFNRTFWNERFEAYIEYEPLTVGRISQLAIHLTRLENHKPVTQGVVKASLVYGNQGIRNAAEMASPGIFVVRLQPKHSGYNQLLLSLDSAAETLEMVLDSIYVYEADGSISSPEPSGRNITFTKEQSWEMDFKVDPTKYQIFKPVIAASGTIHPSSEKEIAITSISAGIVHYQNLRLVMGQQVKQGEWLATIKGDKIMGGVDAEENLVASYASAKAKLAQAKASFDRHQELFEAKIISRADFEMAETEYYVAQAEFDAIASDYFEGGKKVIAPRGGYIKEILVEPGEYVRVGTSLLVLSQNRSLRIQVDLPQKYFSQIERISSMNFRTSSSDTLYGLEEFKGRMVSYGQNLEETGPLIPIYFEVINDGQLLSGSMIEAFVQLERGQRRLIIPNEAIMEDYGRLTVFVQTQGEEYEQREIKVGQTDGRVSVVTSGLEEGERVVSKGAYRVKMASVSETIGGHLH